jgi:hypothetical protein
MSRFRSQAQARWIRRAPRLALAAAVLLALCLSPWAGAQPADSGPPRAPEAQSAAAPSLPGFAELEAAGATIGEIRIVNRDIFDLDNPKEDKWLFRLANKLHIQTQVGVIERALLFKSGDKVSATVIDETERVLRTTRYLYDVHIRPIALRERVVDVEVMTRDTWTLDPGISAGRSGGANTSGIKLVEYNLLGTGVALSYGRSKNVDRTSNDFSFSNERAFGGWTSLSYAHSSNSDGKRDSASVAHPFYALDTRWAAGVSGTRDDRIDSVYSGGVIASQYRHRSNQAEAYGGWSDGRVDGWVWRTSIGAQLQDDAYAAVPGMVAPAQLPADEKLVAPFVRFDLIEDRFEKARNRNLIERSEFFALGFASSVKLGAATTGFGSTRNAGLYSASVSQGFEPFPNHTLTASGTISGQYTGTGVRRQSVGVQGRYYLPQSPTWLFYASLNGDALSKPDVADSLLLGGDNGLRGYPLRYQSGTRRALFTLEERHYTDLYFFQLFRVGAAAFFDMGRAWGGDAPVAAGVNTGWLRNAGLGLRIFNTRAAFSNVLHIDIAVPIDADAAVKKYQFLVKTKTSF